jgi:hypothetical protein
MTTIVVPALSRDPYAAAVMSGAVATGFGYHGSRWLWVPAQGRDDEK